MDLLTFIVGMLLGIMIGVTAMCYRLRDQARSGKRVWLCGSRYKILRDL